MMHVHGSKAVSKIISLPDSYFLKLPLSALTNLLDVMSNRISIPEFAQIKTALHSEEH